MYNMFKTVIIMTPRLIIKEMGKKLYMYVSMFFTRNARVAGRACVQTKSDVLVIFTLKQETGRH